MTRKIRFVALFMALLFCLPILISCSDEDAKPVAYMGDYEVSYGLVKHLTLNFKAQLDDVYGDGDSKNGTIWDDPKTAKKYKPLLEERVWDTISSYYAVLRTCEKYGIQKNVFDGSEVQAAVDANMNTLRANYATQEAYEKDLANAYITEDVWRFVFAIEEMKAKLYSAMKKNKSFISDKDDFHEWLMDGNCVYVQHVARYISENENADVEYETARIMYDGLKSGEYDIGYFINSFYNEDTTNTKPYFMVRHVVKDELLNAALALEYEGDVSEIIRLEDAYYILVRMEEPSDALGNQLNTLLSNYQWGIVGKKVEDTKKDLKFKMTDFGKELDLLEIK